MVVREDELVARIIARPHRVPAPSPIGDDCCWWSPTARTCLSVDTIVCGRHFTVDAPPEAIGRKAAASALSDLAAMGARPVGAVLALMAPAGAAVEILVESCRTELERHGCPLLGGDTSASPVLALSVTVWGEEEPGGRLLHRDGGRVGDVLLVTGRLGGAVDSGRHLRPLPRLDEGRWLAHRPEVSALMDLSDGLASDARRLAAACGCGAALDLAAIPVHSEVTLGDRVRHACCDGEDYELLLVVEPAGVAALGRDWPFEESLTVIGDLVSSPGLHAHGPVGLESLDWQGYEHPL